jgi:hypothetical protein
MARKTWILDTETKGTGANVVPLEKARDRPADDRPAPPAPPPARPRRTKPPEPTRPPQRSAGPLPPGHVRKKATGELGKVEALDPRAGTVTVRWLRQGRTSTVPLASVSRR